jgi:hypothetical protein
VGASTPWQRLADETGRAVEVVTADLNDKADLRRIETLLRTDASITMLVNNAGVAATGPLLASDVNKMDDMILLNIMHAHPTVKRLIRSKCRL